MTANLEESEAADREETNNRVSDEVRAWLARKQLTQRSLANHLGISATSLSFRMKGKTPWAFVELMAIADWLDISLAQLLGSELVNERTPRPMGEGSEGVAVAGLDPATSRL